MIIHVDKKYLTGCNSELELKDFNIAIDADFKAKFGWLEYNLKRVCGIECIDEEEKLLGEKEVIRSIDEINKFYEYSKLMRM